ncbi:MAG: alpha/beta fold hydrolase [Gordonia sp. (in: high G+C Gram-positive bacteria)]
MQSYVHDGLTFDVVDSGTADNGTVVLLHGFPQTAKSWRGVAERLNARGYRTVVPNQRGYSPGARPRGRRAYRAVLLAGDVEALIEQLDCGPVHLVGHDWGAAVAWGVAARRPELLASLTTVSVPHPRAFMESLLRSSQALHSWYMLAFQAPWLPERLAARRPAILLRLFESFAMTDEQAADVLALIDGGGFGYAVNWYRAMPFSSPKQLTRIPVPTSHVWSDDDAALTRKGADLTGEFVSGPFELHVLEGVSHWIPEERPDELTDIIVSRAESARS